MIDYIKHRKKIIIGLFIVGILSPMISYNWVYGICITKFESTGGAMDGSTLIAKIVTIFVTLLFSLPCILVGLKLFWDERKEAKEEVQ